MKALLIVMMIANAQATEVYICHGSGSKYHCKLYSKPDKVKEDNIHYWESDGFKESGNSYSDDSDETEERKTEHSDGFDWTKYIFMR